MSDRGLSDRPMPSSFDDEDDFRNTSALQKITRKIVKEPLIPLGCLLTVAAFANAWRAMRRGDHNQVQRMFRARVMAQGFTVVAIVAGGIYFGNERHKERELWKVQQARKDEEKRQKWIRELEARDEEEKALREKLEKRRGRKKAAATVREESAAGLVQTADNAGKEEGSSVLGSLGGWLGGSKGNGWPDEKARKVEPEAAKK